MIEQVCEKETYLKLNLSSLGQLCKVHTSSQQNCGCFWNSEISSR